MDDENYGLYQIPTQFMAGTSVNFSYYFDNYSSDYFTSNLFLVNSGSSYVVSGTASNNGEFTYYVPASGTAGYVPGDYQFQIVAYSGANAFVTKVGNLTVTPNLMTLVPVDTRTDNKIKLDLINAVIAGHISDDTVEYTIGGRSLTRMSVKDLISLQTMYQARVKEELRKERNQSNTVKYKYKDMYEPSEINRKRIL